MKSRRCRHLLGLSLHVPSSPSFICILPSPNRRRRYLDISMAAADVEFRCFVGGLAWATDNEALEKAFSVYGEIVESKDLINDRETGRSRDFRFVTFVFEQAMRDAIDGMNGSNLNGCNITVNETQSRGGGGGGGFRSGGRGGYGGGEFSRGGGGGYRGGTIMKIDTTETVMAAVTTEKKM
ncbi:small RNA binding protein 1-like [Arachis duranensis]|uniref:Small RNA binding protein 1-like n=1 Tax=Arachis duranensis TaxID=130453 RepID=A0A9C6TUU8_ARADU|nr:small RNA binding protein 1-like [Arachis duranensis]